MAKRNIVNFSDFHAHIFKDFAHPDPMFGTDRFKEQMQVLGSVFHYAVTHEADILFNGDLFHKRGVVDVKVFNLVFSYFEEYSDIQVYLVRGNHDSVNNSLYSPSALDAFNSLPNVTVINTMEKIVTPHYTLYGVGYGDETAEMKTWIKEQAESLDPDAINILCAHIGVAGSTTGQYSHTLDGAFSVGDLYPDKFDIVTLGHYHKSQFLGGLKNVFYVGNTLQTSFSDEGMTKGFYFIKLDGKSWELEFVPTKYTPFVSYNANNAPEDLSGAFIQFVGNVKEAKAVKEIKEKEGLSNIRVTVEKDYSVKPRIDITAGSTPVEVVRAFTTKKHPILEEKALECLREAMEA